MSPIQASFAIVSGVNSDLEKKTAMDQVTDRKDVDAFDVNCEREKKCNPRLRVWSDDGLPDEVTFFVHQFGRR